MVTTFGDNIISAYTGGEPVEAIYANGVKVWPDNPTPSGEYYIKWWPKDLSGTFVIGGETRWLQSYSGYYSGPFLSSRWNLEGTSSYYYYIDTNAFKNTGVVAVETNLRVIGLQAFMECPSLKWFSASECLKLMSDVTTRTAATFKQCGSLVSVYLPKEKEMWGYTFESCYNLRDVDVTNITSIYGGYYAFGYCSSLREITLPNCSYIGGHSTFHSCINLEYIDLPVCSEIASDTFLSCPNIKVIYLGYSGVCTGLAAAGILSTRPSVYVPIEWLSDYKSIYTSYGSCFYPIPIE